MAQGHQPLAQVGWDFEQVPDMLSLKGGNREGCGGLQVSDKPRWAPAEGTGHRERVLAACQDLETGGTLWGLEARPSGIPTPTTHPFPPLSRTFPDGSSR